MANDSPFGLHASVWTRNRARGERLARRLHAGGVYVNDCLAIHSVPALPTGGLGESGFGRVHGIAGLEEMLRPRAILVDRIGLRREPWWFPYSPKATRLLSALLAGRGAGFVRGAREALRRLAGRAG
ncbi:MAG: aldehyde dehydrogenase family protein [Gemmatimonadetes bacterium]|nr:aldehyde dehydrogenase family protein [Gemmatimonadota bacterium]